MSSPAFVLPDLCDAHADLVRVTEPLFSSFGGRPAFGGPIRTVKCFEDNSVVAERLREPGGGACGGRRRLFALCAGGRQTRPGGQ